MSSSCVYLFLFSQVNLWDIFLEVGLLGQSVNVHVILLDLIKFLSIGFETFCAPSDSTEQHLVPHRLPDHVHPQTQSASNLARDKCILVLL